MKVMKKICFFAMIVLISMPAACSVAALVSLYSLPDSTFAEQQNNWQGRKEYEEEGLHILVEFCVYDSENLLKLEEQQLADALDLSGRYIYAYQVSNHPTDSNEEVATFELLDADEKEISESAYKGDTTCHDDGTSGFASTPEVSTKQGVWTFAFGALVPGNHSWFLVFSSDYAPVKGTFNVTKLSDEGDRPVPPGQDVPEPGTIALFGVASGLFAAMRRKKRQAS